MEITRRFMKFLHEMKDPLIQEKYFTPELEENLRDVAQAISQLDFLNSAKNSSLNEVSFLEASLLEGCRHIIKKLKANIDAIGLLHAYLTNYPLNPTNLYKFMTIYTQAFFECTSISILGKKPDSPSFMRMIDGLEIDETEQMKIVEKLTELMVGKFFHATDSCPLEILQPYLAGKNYIGNVIIEVGEDSSHLLMMLHFTKDSPFTGSYIKGGYFREFPIICPIIQGLVDAVCDGSYPLKKEFALGRLEMKKLEMIELHKRYFLSYIATEIQTSFECNIATSMIIGHEEEAKNSLKELYNSTNRSIQMVAIDSNTLELKNNFNWENAGLNHKLSRLWEKFQKMINIVGNQTYCRTNMRKANDVLFEFNKDGLMIYQSQVLSNNDHKNLVNIKDFLFDPTARSVNTVFQNNPHFARLIQNHIEEIKNSRTCTLIRAGQFEDVAYEFIGKRKEGEKKIEGFIINLKDESRSKLQKSPNSFRKDSMALAESNGESPKVFSKLSKMRKMSSARNLGARKVLGDNVDIKALKDTIISEYLPDEITNVEDYKKPHQSISAVNKIKLNVTSKTAFIDSPMNFATNRPIEQMSFCFLSKSTQLSPETLVRHTFDSNIFENWSFDAVNVPEANEKCRLVWAMLNEFGLIKEFNIDLVVLCEFMNRVRAKYNTNSNTFHNFDHGVTVMHGSFYILRHIPNKFTNLVNLGVLISAFCHDADHTGRNNLFEINSLSRLALKYHDKSVLEQHHAAVTFKILSKETSNIFANIKGEDYKQLRKLIIANILATDMKVHFEVMNQFNDVRDRIEKSGEEDFVWNDEDVKTVTGMIVHCADVCGPTKSFQIAYEWSIRVNKEFTIQVREEEALGIPVTPYFKDLDKPYIMAKQEIAFTSNLIKPLWENFNKFFGGAMKIAVNNINANVEEWKLLLEKANREKEEAEAKEGKKIEE